jgi:hypothetical protein
MKPSSRPPRTPSRLSDSIRQRLNIYALVASVTGVGVLALAQPAEAKIVYSPVWITLGLHGAYQLDLNHDNTTDFALYSTVCSNSVSCITVLFLEAPPGAGNRLIGYVTGSGTAVASALRPGSRIGQGEHFRRRFGVLLEARSNSGFFGQWGNVKNRYLGLKFKIKGKTHYGWARLSVNFAKDVITTALTGYAYETVPNKPIIAGKTKGPDVITVQPASLGHLAAGASAIPAWRSGR